MRTVPSVVAVVFAVALTSTGWAQSSPDRGSEPPTKETKEQTPADRAFEPIQRDLSNLHQSLLNKGGVSADDHTAIRALRERTIAFTREFPKDVRGLKAEYLLSTWLKEKDKAEELLRRIVALEPENAMIRMALARQLRLENRYAEALDLMQSNPPAPQESPGDAFIYADCLVAEHRFAEATQVFESIPADKIETQQRAELETMKAAATEYIDLWNQEQEIRRAEEQAGDLPRVMLVTARGPILLELFENEAPNTVANFVNLAEQGFYDATKFHRVLPNFMAQGGDPNTKPGATGAPGMGDPGYFIPDETDREDHRKHFTGSLAMAKTDAPNSGGCQFYITVLPTPHLNGKHTVFGRVIEGLDVARSLKQDDELKVATVVRKRPHEYRPNTLPKTEPVPPPAPAIDDGTAPSPADLPPTQPPAQPEAPPSNEPEAVPQ